MPFLKWRGGEKKALASLAMDAKENILPLIEIVLPELDTSSNPMSSDFNSRTSLSTSSESYLTKAVRDIKNFWGSKPILVDLSLAASGDAKAFGTNEIISAAHEYDLSIIPVVNIRDTSTYISLLSSLHKSYDNGICIRLTPNDLLDFDLLNKQLEAFVEKIKVDYVDIDLVIDLKFTPSRKVYRRISLQIQSITHLNEWRSFVLASGAFPSSLMHCKQDEENLVKRNDWLGWITMTQMPGMIRIPTYGDYTIRHPIFSEEASRHHPSCSLKYTLELEWLVMKGEVLRFDHYLAHANSLMDDDYFYGEEFSRGDYIIREKGEYFPIYIQKKNNNPTKADGTGNATTWIEVGVSHHLAVVTSQLSKLT
ncbi:beta family protein [Candidatus Saccharibacteria bacterium]|nr:beta family protein [Candidatus Saccharibacteria bacterium]